MKGKTKKRTPKRSSIDVQKIERLVAGCLEDGHSLPWYRPDNINSISHWDEIVEAFTGGYEFGLRAILKALQGDDGEALEEILNGEYLITRPEDRAERDTKLEEGAAMMYFKSREEAEAFVKAIGLGSELEEIPPEWLN